MAADLPQSKHISPIASLARPDPIGRDTDSKSLRLLLFNLATDSEDPILGFTTQWIRALAQRVRSIDVITMRAGTIETPRNVRVHSVGKERHYSEPRRALEFYKLLLGILSSTPVDVCFAHMMPLFATMGAPVLKAKGIPIVTWYAYPRATTRLRMAQGLSTRMVTGTQGSYPYRTDKLVVVGHGIDMELFSPSSTPAPACPPMILCTGRLSPIKDHPTLLNAVSLLHRRIELPFRLTVLGGPAGPEDAAYVQSLHERARFLGIEKLVFWHPPVRIMELPSWHRRSALHVNMTRTGSADKVVLEAMACCRPSLTANEDFRATAGAYWDRLHFRYGSPEDLSSKLAYWLTLSRNEHDAAGIYLRKRVVQMHDLEGLADRLVSIFLEVSA